MRFVWILCFSNFFFLLFRHLFNSLLNWIFFSLQYYFVSLSLSAADFSSVICIYMIIGKMFCLITMKSSFILLLDFFNVHNIFFFWFFAFIRLVFKLFLLFIYCKNQMVDCVREFYLCVCENGNLEWKWCIRSSELRKN